MGLSERINGRLKMWRFFRNSKKRMLCKWYKMFCEWYR